MPQKANPVLAELKEVQFSILLIIRDNDFIDFYRLARLLIDYGFLTYIEEKELRTILKKMKSDDWIEIDQTRKSFKVKITSKGIIAVQTLSKENIERSTKLESALKKILTANSEWSIGVFRTLLESNGFIPESPTSYLALILYLETSGRIKLRLGETVYISKS
jgi:hypothetical protein